MKLQDKVAIITGSASGIGNAIALEFLKEGANVVFVDVDKKALEKNGENLDYSEERFFMCETNVLIQSDIESMVDQTMKKYGKIDVLVNHVGDAALKPFSEVINEDFEFAVNMILRSAFWCMKSVLPIMQKQQTGKIINTASVAGKIAMPNSAMMTMCKHGIIGLTKSLAVEYGKYGININSVCPVLVETETTKKRMIPNFGFAKKMVLMQTPLGRLTNPEELAKIYLFLASEDSDFMTGQAVNFTGGFEMR
jgi:NAD(P)-dependent dehydrogenase (short-subunit alcohol dehydrogenase family)